MKKFKVSILPEAEDELRDAYKYYKEINIKLATRFLKTTKSTVNDLRKMPMYQIKFDQIRLRIIHKFPYVIHFMVDEKSHTIKIYGIRHGASNPETWSKK